MRYLTQIIIFSLSISSLVLSGCSAGSRAFSKGEQFEAEGRYEDAMYSYADAFRKDPDSGMYRVRFFKARQNAAEQRYKKGAEQFERGDYVAALAEFQTAYGLDPTQERYKQKINDTIRLRDAQQFYKDGLEYESSNKLSFAYNNFTAAVNLQPDNLEYQAALTRISGLRKSKLEGFELSLKSSKPITLKFKDAKLKDVFKIITQLTGINFIFDEAVKDQPVSIYLENASFEQALDLLTNMHKLHSKVLNESTVILYPKTPEKSKQYDDLTLRTFHLSFMDAKKAVNLIRTMMQVKKIHVNEETNSIIVRDTSDVVGVVAKILEANDVPDPEVVLEVEVLELTEDNTENLGLLLSQYNVGMAGFNGSNMLSDSLSNVTTTAAAGTASTTTTPTAVNNLARIFTMSNGTSGFVTVPNGQFQFGVSLTKGQVLSNPKIRVKNKEKAKFNVGERVPITTTTLNGTISQVNVQYVDVGVKLNAEPSIQLNNEIIIKLSLEVSSILSTETVGGSTAPTSVVTIGTRNLDTVLSLKDGETSVIGGLMQNTTNDTKQKIYLLSDIPLIGPFLTNKNSSKVKTELVLAITPRLVRSVTVPQSSLMSFDTGKEEEPSLHRPLASFDQEVVFEGDSKSSPIKTQIKVNTPIKTLAPIPAGPTTQVTVPAAAAAKPAEETVKKTTPMEPKGSASFAGKISVPPPAAPGAPATVASGTASASSAQLVDSGPVRHGLVQIVAPEEIKVGQQFSVDIKAVDTQNLAGGLLVLKYEPELVEYEFSTEGVFLKSDGKKTYFSVTDNNKEGTLTIKLSRFPKSGGVSGAGNLFSAQFRTKGKGSANFGFSSVNFTSADGKVLDLLPFSTAVSVR